MTISKLTIEHIARIEGHGNVMVDIQDGELRSVEMNINEPARLFESMVKGRSFEDVAYISSRICGICSPSHVVTSLKATEQAFGVEVSVRTKILRKLLIHGSYLQNHATHLYILAAPDYVGAPSVFPLARTNPVVLDRALKIKKLGNDLCTLVGGRPVHPINAVVGGFTAEPSAQSLVELADRLDAIVQDCVMTGDLFATFDVPNFSSDGDLLALTSKGEYAIYEGQTTSLLGSWKRDVGDYKEYLYEKTVPYSNAKISTLDGGGTYVVGAIARINHSWDDLLPSARLVAAKAGLRPVWRNTFKNNISQAIEMVDAAERCAVLCRELAENPGDSSVVDFKVSSGHGIAATEAPRGTVYHDLTFDSDGRVTAANILTPTAQSLGNLENDIRKFAPTIVGLPRDEFILLIEKLIRAYDPCLSCAVH